MKMSASETAMPTGPDAGGGAVGSLMNPSTSWPRPLMIRPPQRTTWSDAIWNDRADVVADVVAGVDLLEGPHAERPDRRR